MSFQSTSSPLPRPPPVHPPNPMPPPSNRARAMAQKANEMTVVYFTASIAALAVILITAHLIRTVLISYSPQGKGALGRRTASATRVLRSVLLHEMPFFNTLGNTLVFAAYFGINIALTLQNLDLSQSRYWAKRAGWMATCNIALITFLALKNTPLAFLTGYSYERLNILHQAAGYCTVFFALLHGLLFIGTDAKAGRIQGLLEQDNVMGIVAGFAMITIFTTALVLRKLRYEAFYIVHITMFMLILITVGLHRPDFETKSIYVIIFAACIWSSDRLLRGFRIIYHSFSNRATISPLPHGGVRIVLRRTPWRAIPGTHVFLWIPTVRAFETHPFTIVSTNPLELVVSAHDGFTRDLYSLASKSPSAVLRASCDGPYGALPDFAKFNHVVLIAGGSGATFTLGVALNLIRNMPEHATRASARPMIHFTWAIRNHEMQTWFAKELAELSASPLVALTVYVTRSIDAASNMNVDSDHEKSIPHSKSDQDPEKSASSPTSPQSTLPIMLGRPDVNATIRAIVGNSEERERTVVAACGPESLMRDTRGVVAELVVRSGRSVELHCEQFGW